MKRPFAAGIGVSRMRGSKKQVAHVAGEQRALDQQRRDRDPDRAIDAVEPAHQPLRPDQPHHAAALRADQRRGAQLGLGGRSDVAAVEPERLGEQAAHRFAERLPGHASEDLAGEPAEGEGVVGAAAARRELRRRFGERLGHVLPVADALGPVEQRADLRKPGAVREHVAQRDRGLAGLARTRARTSRRGPRRRSGRGPRARAAPSRPRPWWSRTTSPWCPRSRRGRRRRARRPRGPRPCGRGGRRRRRRRPRCGAPADRGCAPPARSPARPCRGSPWDPHPLLHPHQFYTFLSRFPSPAAKPASPRRLIVS